MQLPQSCNFRNTKWNIEGINVAAKATTFIKLSNPAKIPSRINPLRKITWPGYWCKLLFHELFKECAAKGFTEMAWQVLDWNEPAINFYKKLPNVKFDGEWVNCSVETPLK